MNLPLTLLSLELHLSLSHLLLMLMSRASDIPAHRYPAAVDGGLPAVLGISRHLYWLTLTTGCGRLILLYRLWDYWYLPSLIAWVGLGCWFMGLGMGCYGLVNEVFRGMVPRLAALGYAYRGYASTAGIAT